MLRNAYIFVVMLLGTTGCVHAERGAIEAPVAETQSMIIDNTKLTAGKFWRALRSENLNERRFAEMYLAGVLDSTEGKTWCGYSVALPHSILDQVNIGLKKASEEIMADRASSVIERIISKILPCRDK